MRRWADSWNRADLDAFADLFDANAELITDPSWMEAGPVRGRAAITGWCEGTGTVEGGGYRGRDGIEKYLVHIGDTWEEYRVFAEEFRDLDDRVVMLGRSSGQADA